MNHGLQLHIKHLALGKSAQTFYLLPGKIAAHTPQSSKRGSLDHQNRHSRPRRWKGREGQNGGRLQSAHGEKFINCPEERRFKIPDLGAHAQHQPFHAVPAVCFAGVCGHLAHPPGVTQFLMADPVVYTCRTGPVSRL